MLFNYILSQKCVIILIMKKYLFLYICTLIAALGGLLSGYDTGVISGALIFINQNFHLTSFLSGLLVASVSLGAVFGAFVNGFLADKIGRKNTLILISIVFLIASIFCAVSKNPTELIIARFMLGIGVGVVSFICPLYISEISPKEKRGSSVCLFQLAITFGILFSYNWRLMLLFGVVPSLVLLFGMLFIKDTPRWYVMKGKIQQAKEVLLKFNPKCDIDFELNEISKTFNSDKKLNKKLLIPLFIGFGIMFFQVSSGINSIIYYAPMIFKSCGFEADKTVLLYTIFIGLVNFLMTFFAIAYVDKWGRKPLLYVGLSFMSLSLFGLFLTGLIDLSFIKYFSIIFSTLYIIFFSMSIGPIALLLISEIFPLEYRASAMSFAIIVNFVFNFIVTGLFPIGLEKLGSCVFLIFAFVCILGILFVKKFVPETKGVLLEDISKDWNL